MAELILLGLLCSRKWNVWFYVVFSLILSAVGFGIVQLGILDTDIWAWRQGLICLSFLALGGLYWRYEKKIDGFKKWWIVLPVTVFYLGMVIGMKEYSNPLVSTLGIQPLGFVTSAIACILLVWLCKSMPEWKHLTFIVQNSIGFYFISGALPVALSKIVHKVLPGTYSYLLPVIALSSLSISYFIVMVINKWMLGCGI